MLRGLWTWIEAEGNRERVLTAVLCLVLVGQACGVMLVRHLSSDLVSRDFLNFYEPAATAMLDGEPVTTRDGRPIWAEAPIGYPAYLAGLIAISRITGLTQDTVIVTSNLLLNLVTITALFLLGYHGTGRVAVAAATALLAAFYPAFLYLSKQGLQQPVALPFMAWALYAVYRGYRERRPWLLVLAGLLLGLGALIRPLVIATLVLVLAYLLVCGAGRHRDRLLRPALVLGAFVLAILPWELYLYGQTGQILPLTALEIDYLHDIQVGEEVADSSGLLPFIAGTVAGACRAWYETDTGRNQEIALLGNLPYLVLLAIGAVVGLRHERWRWATGLGLAVLAAAWGASAVTYHLARYTATGVILASLVSGIGLVWIRDRLWGT